MATAPTHARSGPPERTADPAPIPAPPDEQRLLLHGVSWETYESLLRDREAGASKVRMTYDDGDLEFMTLGLPHESWTKQLGRLVETLTEELNIPIRSGRSTTFRKQLAKRGLEPDECYWIAREALVRGKSRLDLAVDPAPDLAIEVEHTRSALDRLSIYGTLGFAEVWRFDGSKLRVVRPRPDGSHAEQDHSDVFPFLPPAEVERFLTLAGQQDETAWIRSFRAWVRATLAPDHARPA